MFCPPFVICYDTLYPDFGDLSIVFCIFQHLFSFERQTKSRGELGSPLLVDELKMSFRYSKIASNVRFRDYRKSVRVFPLPQ